jgi:UDP-3-O-[3-hydroxymyristoyl] glucosamine N-acyltransferase
MEFTARQIAEFLSGTVVGNPETKVNNLSKIEDGFPDTITFLANPKYEHYIYNTKASIVLVNNDFIPTSSVFATLVKVDNVYASLAKLLNFVEQRQNKKEGISSSAFISKSATLNDDTYIGTFAYIGDNTTIGKGSKIYPHAYVGDNVSIGDNVTIYPNVTIYDNSIIGNDCIFHSGAVIGADGFGFAKEDGEYNKIPQTGNVIIEDCVEVGANTTIDKPAFGSTIIRRGVKLDNLIQIAHNVEVGTNTAMAAQAGIAGSTKVGKDCIIGGQVGLGGHINIGDNSQIGAQAGILGNIKPGSKVMGSPEMPVKDFMRSSVLIKKLPEIYKTLISLKSEIEELKKSNNPQICKNKKL